MGDLFLLSERQMARIAPHFPLAHGVPRVDDRRVVSGIVTSSSMACNVSPRWSFQLPTSLALAESRMIPCLAPNRGAAVHGRNSDTMV
ncbi:hypothetical protein HNQ66_004615 [Shinella fusca]|uniref:Uncharacterized protein n=1 Tax=Shinella fusca TaxID=544480 RepID=A0A7W8DXS8_9HYPH|nr:hypothetical protein [Shinella fusca]